MTSPTKLVQTEIKRFLASSEPEVISVTGDWGVGKTFTWDQLFKQAKNDKRIALRSYSYVSLFGLNSLDDLKEALVENTDAFGMETAEDMSGRASSFFNWAFSHLSKKTRTAEGVPQIGGIIKAIRPFLFSAVRDRIVCIDDLDRRGDSLNVRDVFGLATFLKEQRKCKVIILSNSQELGTDGFKEYKTHFEKVVDLELTFDPTAREAAEIALQTGDEIDKKIKANVIQLGIKNIRVIKKIERQARNLHKLVSGIDDGILHQAIHSITLFGWSKYQPAYAPPLDFLKSRMAESNFGLEGEKSASDDEAAWRALLKTYGFSWTDELDRELINGIEKGYFDPIAIKEFADKMSQNVDRGRQVEALQNAWDLYHGSFDDNEAETLDTIYETTKANIKVLTHGNLNSTVKLFKELGRSDQAQEILDYYVEHRDEPRDFWDYQRHGWPGDITDPDVLNAFSGKLANLSDNVDPIEIFQKLSKSDGWNPEDLQVLASLSVDDYRQIFKDHRGAELNRLISFALGFFRVANASDPMNAIANNAKAALEEIGKESELNSRRVRKFGIVVEDGEEPNDADQQIVVDD